jgi:CheY-like chemotaxis protein
MPGVPELTASEALAVGCCVGLLVGLALLILTRWHQRPEGSATSRRGAGGGGQPTPRPTPTPSDKRLSLAQSEREVAAVWLQFLRKEVADTVGAVNTRLTAIRALLAGLGQGDLSAAQRGALERIGTELDRATAATADLHRQVSSSAPAPARPSVTTGRPRTVRPGVLLVVDSDDTIRDVLGQLFRAAGHRVIPARDGVEAFTILQQEPVDCVISETRVSRLSGEGLYAQVEQRLPHLARRFVFVSGSTQQADVREFLERSGRPVVPKPFDVELLVDAVNAVLEAVQSATRETPAAPAARPSA